MRTAFFHKDNYCVWEILPLAANEFCLKEMDKIDDFVEKQRVGGGFTDLYVREDNSHKMEELPLRSEQLDAACSFLSSYDRVETGCSSYRKECKATYGRGEGPGQNIFWSVNGEGLVNAIWLDLWIRPETKEQWKNILIVLGHFAPVLLVDWGWRRYVDLTSVEDITRYVEDKANV